MVYDDRLHAIERLYRNHLIRYCSDFKLRGLPAAGELLHRQISLEDIYFPVELLPSSETMEQMKLNQMIWERAREFQDDFLEDYHSPFYQTLLADFRAHLSSTNKLPKSRDEFRSLLLNYIDGEIARLENELALMEQEGIDEPDKGQTAPQGDIFGQALPDFYDNKPVGPLSRHKPSRKIILSRPGYGKTTFMKRIALAYAAADRKFKDRFALPGDLMPVLLPCGHLNITRDIQDYPAFEDWVRVMSAPIWGEPGEEDWTAFRKLLCRKADSGQLLIMVDGFDEIFDPALQLHFSAALARFMRQFPMAHLVMTSREATFEQERTPAIEQIGGIRHMVYNRILPLSRERIATFCRQWYEVVFPHDEENARRVEKIIAQLQDDRFRYIREMASVPLHLSNILAITRWHGAIPNNKHQLFDQYLTVELNWHGDRRYNAADVKMQFAYVAFHMMKNNMVQITRNQLKDVLEQCSQDLEGMFVGSSHHDIDTLIDDLEVRTCILQRNFVEDGEPVYRFTHLQIQEYLAATAIVFGYVDPETMMIPPVELLVRHGNDTRWREVIIMALLQEDRLVVPTVQQLIAMYRESNERAVFSLLLEILSDGVNLAEDLKHPIYDLLFRDQITDTLIRRIGEFMKAPQSGELIAYIEDQYKKSYENHDTDYSLAQATIQIYKCLEAGEHPLEWAERQFIENKGIGRRNGSIVWIVVSWCKYSEIQTRFSDCYDFQPSREMLEAVRDAVLDFEDPYWDDTANLVHDMNLANYADFRELLNESFFRRLVEKYKGEVEVKAFSPCVKLLSMFPVDRETLRYDTEFCDPEFLLRVVKRYEEAAGGEKVFLFAVSAVLKCWVIPDGLVEEFEDLEQYYKNHQTNRTEAGIQMARLREQISEIKQLERGNFHHGDAMNRTTSNGVFA